MNKDIKGLLKYILLLCLIWLTPIAILYCGLIAYGLSDHYNDYFAMVFLLLALVLFIFYFILPIIFTYKAMKHHWSKYLDKFFYNNWLPTIVLIILISFDYRVEHHVYSNWTIYQVLSITLMNILPCYCVAYLTIIITRFLNWYKNK